MSLFGVQGELIFDHPDEDAGADTASRYYFQYHCATRYCIELLHQSSVSWVLCEWHTDYVVGLSDGSMILVSVKHRDVDAGHWTIRKMCVEGGLATLYKRWQKSGMRHQCRWTTNAGLSAGKREARALAQACAARNETETSAFAESLWVTLGSRSAEEAQAFLRDLRIESGVPDRHSIRANNVERYMRTAINSIGRDAAMAWDAYDAIVEIVAEAMRGCDNREPREYWLISDPAFLDDSSSLARVRRSRTIDRERVLTALKAVPVQREALLLPGRSPQSKSTRLGKKLAKGGIEASMISAARRLRRAWQTLEFQYRNDLPGPDEIDDIRTRVHLIAARAAQEAQEDKSNDGQYGKKMMTLIERNLSVESLGRKPFIPIDSKHLLGLVYQLTEECELWWSPPFDVEKDEEDAR